MVAPSAIENLATEGESGMGLYAVARAYSSLSRTNGKSAHGRQFAQRLRREIEEQPDSDRHVSTPVGDELDW